MTSYGRYEDEVTRGGSPTVRRRELGALLRSLRDHRRMTAEEVTERLLFSPTKLSRIETGQSGASARDIRDLCQLYEVTDAQREELMTLAREGKQRGWWQDYDLPNTFSPYVGLEAEASSLDLYQSGAIPGLLQTEEYVRAMLRTRMPPFSPQELQLRLQARLTRQLLLAQDESSRLRLHAILDEAALHRRVGGPEVMAAQLRHLAVSAQRANVVVQVIPFDVGAHVAMESNFCILSFDQGVISDVVYVEGLVGSIYLERPADKQRYSAAFSQLCDIALNQADSVSLIATIAENMIFHVEP